ncbi:MAG: hypothetical protein ABR512_05190 [Desulfopila sp.]
MKTQCSACGKQLKLSAKILESVTQLEAGRNVRIKCPGCKEPIILDSSMLTEGHAGATGSPQARAKVRRSSGEAVPKSIKPPAPPDISWIEEGVFENDDVIEDVPLALVLMEDGAQRDTVVESIEGIGYKTEFVKDSREAMQKMEFVEYSAVVLQSGYDGEPLAISKFHQHMYEMNMSRRRFIFYTLIGKEFQTLYNLEALANSANLVVNDNEIPYFNVILRKAIPEYEELFGPITEELRLQGK